MEKRDSGRIVLDTRVGPLNNRCDHVGFCVMVISRHLVRTNNNLIAAGSILVAIPTLIVFFALQKQFVSGLTLGSTKE